MGCGVWGVVGGELGVDANPSKVFFQFAQEDFIFSTCCSLKGKL